MAFEMVGYGQSWAHGKGRDISLKAQARYLGSWLEEIGISRAVLVGHDLGGGVAQIAAVEDRARYVGLVLTNAVAYDSWPIPSVKGLAALGPVVQRLPSPLFRRLYGSFIRQGHDDRRRAAESVAAHGPGYAHAEGAATFVRQTRSLRTSDTLEIAGGLRELDRPAAVVWGAVDRFQKLEYGRRLAGDLGAALTTVDAGKHFMPEDHPDEVAAAVRDVLERAAA